MSTLITAIFLNVICHLDITVIRNGLCLLQVTDTHRLWGWMRQEFLPNIYKQPWYNGIKENKDVYIENKMSILIGMPWMRQLRIKKSKRNTFI